MAVLPGFVQQEQTGTSDSPYEQQGGCFRACVASLLAIPYEDAFDAGAAFQQADEGGPHWWDAFYDWTSERGWIASLSDESSGGIGIGLNILGGVHADGSDLLHAVLVVGRHVVWDPLGRIAPEYHSRRLQVVEFVPLDPAFPPKAALDTYRRWTIDGPEIQVLEATD